MTALNKGKISCRNCHYAEQTDWMWEHSIVVCMNEKSDHYQHLMQRDHVCNDKMAVEVVMARQSISELDPKLVMVG